MPQEASRQKIVRELERLKKAVTIKIEAYYKKNIKGSQQPIDFIRQNDKQIQQIVRDAVQESWLFSHIIISDVTGDKINLTVQDVQGIEITTNEMVNMYWTTAGKNLTRETEFKVDEQGQLLELPLFALHAAMLGIASYMVYFGYNEGVQSKAGELGGIRLKLLTRNDPQVDPVICRPLHGTIYNFNQAPTLPLHRHCRCILVPVIV